MHDRGRPVPATISAFSFLMSTMLLPRPERLTSGIVMNKSLPAGSCDPACRGKKGEDHTCGTDHMSAKRPFFESIKHYVSSPEKLKGELIRPFQSFFSKEASSSILLIAITSLAFLWANSPWASTYHRFWETKLSLSIGDYSIAKSLRHWIDEGLMTVFFFIVGLEIKREVMVGELASLKKALLPVGAAIGGMLLPAGIFAAINHGESTITGWGIPMATDIAFALGALSLFGRRIPLGLRVFLSAFAIADDLGAVLIIALFYTQEIALSFLGLAVAVLALLALANYLWVRHALVYALLGIALWSALLFSGLHATVAGVVVALFIPARGKYETDRFVREVEKYLGNIECPPDGCGFTILLNEKHLNSVQSIEVACHNVETPLQRLEHSLHPWVAFLIVPLFGLANAGFTLGKIDLPLAMTSPLTLGIAGGLLLGKPLGIILFSYLFVRARAASLPTGVTWVHILGAGLLGGLGFTMSLFIAGLSFADASLLDYAKMGILGGSILSGLLGMILFRFLSREKK